MLRLALAQMRRSISRLAAAGIAIAIGTAFVTATLLAGNVMNRSTTQALAAQFAGADLVVTAQSGGTTPKDLTAVRRAAGVRAADTVTGGYIYLSSGSSNDLQFAVPTPSSADLNPLTVTKGRLPRTADEIALPTDLMRRLGVAVGTTVTADVWQDPDAGADPKEVRLPLHVVGSLTDKHGAYTETLGAAMVVPSALDELSGMSSDTPARIAVITSGSTAQARASITAALPHVTVRTPEQYAHDLAASVTAGQDELLFIVLAFAGVSLLVAALVIANTFQVLVAQRTRLLALLRAVGASRRQVAASVTWEALFLAVTASIAGVIGGCGLTQLALSVWGPHASVPLPGTIEVSWQTVVIPLAVGVAVTLVAALSPARSATRVAPLAALRPMEGDVSVRRGGKARLIWSLTLIAFGLLLLGGALALTRPDANQSPGAPLALAVLGGSITFVGVLVAAVFWVPTIIRLLGKAIAHTGPTSRLAAANAGRNPRRTAATTTALLIGVTLVTMMSTGAATARVSLNSELDSHYMVDLTVQTTPGQTSGPPPGFAPGTEHTVARTSGVAAVTSARSITVDTPKGNGLLDLLAARPDQLAKVLRVKDLASKVTPNTVVMSTSYASTLGIRPGPLTLSLDGRTTNVTVVTTESSVDSAALTTPAVVSALSPKAAPNVLLVKLDSVTDPAGAVSRVRDAVTAQGSGPGAEGSTASGPGAGSSAEPSVLVNGPAVERARLQSSIDGILAVVIGLLGIAVIIAVVGVANTLSLSVIERRRESATLRAIGLTRGRLRTTLAIEGTLLAGVGAGAGIVLGVAFGFAAARAVFSVFGSVAYVIPWRDLVATVIVALLAGVLASVLPARSATRTSPAEALAQD